MVNNAKISIDSGTSSVKINSANVTTPDVISSNGIIHVIDEVLLPPLDLPGIASTTGIHNSLVDA